MKKERFKLIDLATVKKVSSLFAGNYKTVFHGAGIEFNELKQYGFGEDVKNIDWLTSAKTGNTFVKKYVEERELETLFLFDVGESMYFASGEKTKIDTAIEIFSILAFSSLKNNDKIGSVFFKDQILKEFESRKGISNLLMMINYLNETSEINKIGSSSLDDVLEKLYIKKKKNSLIFILSDFTGDFNCKFLKALAIKNDIVFINIFDEFEDNLNLEGIHSFSGNNIVNLGNSRKIEEYRILRKNKKEEFRKRIIRFGGDHFEINEKSQVFSVLYKFFKSRQI
ncbi:MAG: DUF58 domain-containing protein [Candidatus Gracilibacteria bacterium]|nr:DUF58 domain-containing protein [Candidatus Gracilibacteria bacterium]